MARVPKPIDQLLFRKLAFASAAIAKGVDESEELVQDGIADGRCRNSLVQRFQTDTALFSLGERPHRREFSS
jgi:hypothetical protein